MIASKAPPWLFYRSLRRPRRPKGSSPVVVVLLLAWAAALFGVLQVGRIEGIIGHRLCGPWGCGPPGEALICYHGFWAVLLWPMAVLVGLRAPQASVRQVGLGLFTAGLLVTVGIMAWGAIDWMAGVGATRHQYVVQRAVFVLATMVDVPALQLAGAGLLCYVVGRRRQEVTQTLADLQQQLPEGVEGNQEML